MATYLIGDVHGCYNELMGLLEQVEFSPAQGDILWLSGDLVARGPSSLEVLRYIKSLGNNVRIVLGNHDLHLLAIHEVFSHKNTKNQNQSALFFKSEDTEELLSWLRHQPLLQIDENKKLIMSHAGIPPQWDLSTAKECASYIENILKSASYQFLLEGMYGDAPSNWSKSLDELSRLRFILNALTRMRYCLLDGRLNMSFKDSPKNAPSFLKPWFEIPGLISKNYSIAFGHWASLFREKGNIPERIYALDDGCCWGGNLICLRWEDKKYFLHPSHQ